MQSTNFLIWFNFFVLLHCVQSDLSDSFGDEDGEDTAEDDARANEFDGNGSEFSDDAF